MSAEQRPRVHYCAPYILNPVHPVTVDLVGCGGSGSMMLSCLARIDRALRGFDKKGLQVRLHDPDTVGETNIGRQLFIPGELGMNKAVALATRFNRSYGRAWEAFPEKYRFNSQTNIIITCTDNIASRRDIANQFGRTRDSGCGYGTAEEHRNWYWMDLGNARSSGQAVLGSVEVPQPKSAKYETVGRLPDVHEMFRLSAKDETDSGPSCSLAEALSKQDLFINSCIAQMAGHLLWELFRYGLTDRHGFFLNLDTMNMKPIMV